MKPTTKALAATLAQISKETGVALKVGAVSLAQYAEAQGERLLAAQANGEPGLEDAALAARGAILLHAGIVASDEGDATDQRVIGAVHSFLAFLLAAALG